MNTSKKSQFIEDIYKIDEQSNIHPSTLEKYKMALKECQIILKAMKAELLSLQNQLKQKNAIIDKLISQKQDHILHLYSCQGDSFKKQLQLSQKKNEEMKQKINMITLKYEQIIKKNQEEFERLKGFNKVLRIENKHLREDNSSLKNSNTYQTNKKIGAISKSLSKSKEPETPIYSYTINSKDLTQFNLSKVYYQDIQSLATPQKISRSRQISKDMSTQARSTNRYARNQQLNKNYQYPSAALFQKQSNSPESTHKAEQQITLSRCQDKSKEHNNMYKIEGWFKKLKSLLDDSDED